MLLRIVYLRDFLPIIFRGHVGDVKNTGAEGGSEFVAEPEAAVK